MVYEVSFLEQIVPRIYNRVLVSPLVVIYIFGSVFSNIRVLKMYLLLLLLLFYYLSIRYNVKMWGRAVA